MKKIITIISLLIFVTIPVHTEAKLFKVKRVIDGDTFLLQNSTRVRLIGIDTPEISDKECYSKKAKKKLRQLIKGKRVRLKYDEDKWDKYDRKLAYVYKGKKFINKYMVVAGYAEVMIISPNNKKEAALNKARSRAKEKNRGIWNKCRNNYDYDGDGYNFDEDCNDEDSNVYSEIKYYRDKDGDGYGNKNDSVEVCSTTAPEGYVDNWYDSDDEPEEEEDNDNNYTCSSNSYNCSDFNTQKKAQEVYDYCVSLGYGDIHDLDRDNDGEVCESLP